MNININCCVELLNIRDFKEFFLFGTDFPKAISFLDQKIKLSEYKEGLIKLTIKKG